MHKWAHCSNEAANHQLPIASAFWIIWIVSVEECSSLTQNLMQIRCSTRSVILNVMATLYTCSLSGVYCTQWLVQWSRHCSCMYIPAHAPWLPGHIDVAQTVLIIWTTAGLFPDRPCTTIIWGFSRRTPISKEYSRRVTRHCTQEQLDPIQSPDSLFQPFAEHKTINLLKMSQCI